METHSSLYDINSIGVATAEIEEGEITHQQVNPPSAPIDKTAGDSRTCETGQTHPSHEKEAGAAVYREEPSSVMSQNVNTSQMNEKLNPVKTSLSSHDNAQNPTQNNAPLANYTGIQNKTPIVPLQPIKRVATEERPAPEKKQDPIFVPPSGPAPRISRMSSLTPEEHERLQAANARKIEAVKLTMAEVPPSTPKTKRPSTSVYPTAPPKKRGRPKGSANKGRTSRAQASISYATMQPRASPTASKTNVNARALATQSCLDLSCQNFVRRRFTPSAQSSMQTLDTGTRSCSSSVRRNDDISHSCSQELPKPPRSNQGNRERAKSWTTTVSSDPGARIAQRGELSTATTETCPSDDGCITPPLCIVEESAVDTVTSLETKPSHQKSKSRQMRLEKEADAWIRYLIKELTSILPSSQDEQKLKIACSLQNIICEQRDLQHLASMITLLETEVNERFQQINQDVTRGLDEHMKKCNHSASKTTASVNSVRSELVRVIELCHTLRQTVSKHSIEMEAIRTSLRASNESMRQTTAELNDKLESLKRERDELRAICAEHRSHRNLNLCNLNALFPPPPPPPPLPPTNSKDDHREDETSTPENVGSKNRQRPAANRGMDTHEASTSNAAPVVPTVNPAVTNPPPMLPLPSPFYGPLFPPPQKMMYDYFQLQQLQQMQQSLVPPLPPFLPNMMMDGNQMPLQYQPPALDQRNARLDGYNQQRNQTRANENAENVQNNRVRR
ncbi:hypothetical protein Y032_0360g3454 [Ancylostoma ceylanicum]|uniref:Uncharacterized protein n=1 Tax=Ancylostoma ceylanicum TaxID=53326 RepID=A0A016RVT6_9BILA|nr:hypothetical protein Y032_0360g3454 [Ancylostoma ceylanicum]